MHKYSIGTDIEEISRFSKFRKAAPFLKKSYSGKELKYCFNKANPAEHLAGRFAAKEAVIKALASFSKQPIGHKNIEIINDNYGIPRVFIKKRTKNKTGLSLSISHTKELALAVAVAFQNQG